MSAKHGHCILVVFHFCRCRLASVTILFCSNVVFSKDNIREYIFLYVAELMALQREFEVFQLFCIYLFLIQCFFGLF